MILLRFLIFSENLHALQGLLLYYFLTFMIIAVAAASVLQLFSFLFSIQYTENLFISLR